MDDIGRTCCLDVNFNPRAPRGDATAVMSSPPCPGNVSIHAPRAERIRGNHQTLGRLGFNPRARHAGACSLTRAE